MLLLEAIEQLKTVELATLQPNVEENEIGPASNDSRMSGSSSTIRMSDAMVFAIDRRRVNVLTNAFARGALR